MYRRRQAESVHSEVLALPVRLCIPFAKTWVAMVWVLPCTLEVHACSAARHTLDAVVEPQHFGIGRYNDDQRTIGSISISVYLNSNLFTLTRSTNPTLFDSGLVGMRGVP